MEIMQLLRPPSQRKICFFLPIFVVILFLLCRISSSADESYQRLSLPQTASWDYGKEKLFLTAGKGFGGAISSLRFRGKEYIDATDHGRLLSGAIQLDGWGECLNPTLPGSLADPLGKSTSLLLDLSYDNHSYMSVTRMAYWLAPGEKHHINPVNQLLSKNAAPCSYPPSPQNVTSAVNTAALSSFVYKQALTVSQADQRPIIDDNIVLMGNENYSEVIFEALTAYLPRNFNKVFDFDNSTRQFIVRKNVSSKGFEQDSPTIIATTDERNAIAFLADKKKGEIRRYSAAVMPTVSKINVVFRPSGEYQRGAHAYHLMIAVGSLAEVESTIDFLVSHER